MFFDFDALYNEASGDAFAAGKKRYYENKVKNLSLSQADGKSCVHAQVEGERTYAVRVLFDEQGGLYDYACDCGALTLSDGPCKHIVAAALSFEEKNPQSASSADPRRKSDPSVIGLIGEYNKQRHRRMMTPDAEKVVLVPYLMGGEDPALRFSIGRSKQYNVKDIADFITCMRAGSFRRYGVDLELYHILGNFTERAQRLVRFLLDAYGEKERAGGAFMRYKDEMRLYGHDVDEFFALYEGTLVYYGKTETVLVAPFDAPPPVRLEVQRVKEGFTVRTNLRGFDLIRGKSHDYLVTGGRVHRVTHEFMRTAGPTLSALSAKDTLFISEGDMSPFYNSVVVQLSGLIEVATDDVDLSVYEAAPLVAKAYVGSADGMVSLTLECSYDDVTFDLLSDNAAVACVRDWDSENALRGVLAAYFPHYPALYLDREEDIFLFLSEGVKALFDYAEVFLLESMRKARLRAAPRIHVGVRTTNDLLRLDLAAEGYTREELNAILSAYRERRRYIRLGGGFVSLDDPSIGALSDVLKVARLTDGSFTLPRYYAPYVNSELKNGFFALDRDNGFKALIKSLEGAENGDAAVPDTLKDIMRNYQKTGFRWLKTLAENDFGGILADDMGLGKTLQMIALLLDKPCRALIVCPTTLMLNWLDELKKFAPSLKTAVIMGTQEERRIRLAASDGAQVLITSYDLLRRDAPLYEGETFDYAVADEAQFIKNPDTKSARAVKRIHARHRFALTGTPVENNLSELWSIFDFIMPGYLNIYNHFREHFEIDILRGDEAAARRLSRTVKPFILRRLKSDVLKELPPKVESRVLSPLEGKQKELYEANLALVRDSMAAAPDISRVVVLSYLTKLRQICCEPRLVYPEYDGNSAKLEMCMELIGQAVEGEHKVLLFSQFTTMLDIIREEATKQGMSYYLLRGDTPKAERLRLVNRFNSDDTKLFLISLKAGGTGINLTGADVVIHYDPWWNESVMNQATDRAYRMGQNKSVQVYKLILKDTLEEKIMQLQEKKSALSTRVVGQQNSVGEILALLSEAGAGEKRAPEKKD